MIHAWAYPLPPFTMTSYSGEVTVNHNVTIYSDDTCMGVPHSHYDVI